jgi:hypothetical protein
MIPAHMLAQGFLFLMGVGRGYSFVNQALPKILIKKDGLIIDYPPK